MNTFCRAAIVLLAFALASPSMAEVTVTFEGGEILVGGLLPMTDAVIFGLARLPQGFSTLVVRHRHVAIADNEGKAAYSLDAGEVPRRSTWAVVDLTNGDYAIAAPEQFGVRRSAALAAAVPASLTGGSAVRFAREAVEVLVVRPGMGAWWLGVRDGSSADRGAEVGSIEAEPAAFESLGDVAVPFDGPRTEDLVIAIDPQRLEIEVVRLSGEGQGP